MISPKEKKCVRCKQIKPVNQFYLHSKKTRQLMNICKECNTVYCREKRYKRIYDLPPEKYYHMYTSQNGKCLICGSTYPVLSVDHSHATGKVRGLLCKHCNYNLGRYKERVDIFQAFIDYINANN